MASTLTVDNIQGATTAANVFITGHVIQHKIHHIRQTTEWAPGTAGTYIDLTGSSFSFTPKQSGSKLLITMINHFYCEESGTAWNAGTSRLVVDGNGQPHNGSDGLHYNVGIRDTANSASVRLMAYDSQEHEYTTTGTSAITIKCQGYKQSGANIYINKYGQGSVRVLEIAQ